MAVCVKQIVEGNIYHAQKYSFWKVYLVLCFPSRQLLAVYFRQMFNSVRDFILQDNVLRLIFKPVVFIKILLKSEEYYLKIYLSLNYIYIYICQTNLYIFDEEEGLSNQPSNSLEKDV